MLKKTEQICNQYGIKPKHKHGQNFLIDEGVYECIIEAADIKPDETILEVGPGLGFLTERLAAKAKKVITVEIDPDICRILPLRLGEEGITNVELINADILSLPDLPPFDKIVANLPYNISARFLRYFLSGPVRPKSLVLMLQKEVVERICAQPPEMSILACAVQYYAKPTYLETVAREAFWPAPQVTSALVRIDVNPEMLDKQAEKMLFQLIKIGFAAKRKMLKNNLAAGFRISTSEAEERLLQSGVLPNARAQELSLADWERLGTFF